MECKDGFGSVRWPDGRALLDQPMKLIRAFGIAYEIESKFRKKSEK
jgi:hypothetical protein